MTTNTKKISQSTLQLLSNFPLSDTIKGQNVIENGSVRLLTRDILSYVMSLYNCTQWFLWVLSRYGSQILLPMRSIRTPE